MLSMNNNFLPSALNVYVAMYVVCSNCQQIHFYHFGERIFNKIIKARIFMYSHFDEYWKI